MKGSEENIIKGRNKAVREAKRISQRWHGPVEVSRDDERVEMTFRGGALSKYKFNTRRRR